MKKKLLKLFLVLLLFASYKADAQNRTITGTVTGKDDGQPIPGVSVIVKGTQNGVQTGANGAYTVKVPTSANVTLAFSFIGYVSQDVVPKSTRVDVALSPDTKQLKEVAVVGAGGILRKPDEQGYAATRITSSELTAGKSPTIAGGLIAKVPGLQINAVSSGVNPNYRLVLRGNRSLTGNNQALIVLDNVVVPNEVLGNLNPEDVDNITVLNGASGAALYGSDASNGALLITTKKGKLGTPTIRFANTTTLEQISFYPKLQNQFGSGSTSGSQVYDPIENQQYGPAFDGTTRQIGRVLEDGSVQKVAYSSNWDKYNFWNTGVSNQTDFSISSGNDNSTLFMSGQYVDGTGTTPKDTYNRLSLRLNGTRNITPKLSANYSIGFIENKYDITSATSTIYDNLLNTPADVPLLSYKNWQTDKFANPNGYYNDYYENPYWAIDNYRSKTKNNYLTGQAELKYKAFNWLEFTYRAGISDRFNINKAYSQGFTYSNYTLANSSKDNKSSNVSDESYTTRQFNSDFLANFKKDVKDFSFNLVAGASIRTYSSKDEYIYGSGLQIAGLYNINNITGNPTASESNTATRQYGIWGDLTAGYKKYLYLHITGRNDWVSVLDPKNRSFFYPSADFSFIPTKAFEGLKDNKVLDYLKIRGSVSKVGLVNVDPYSTVPTFGSITGYTSGTFYSQSSRLISTSLKPEITKSVELGADFKLFNELIDGSVTGYFTRSTNQVVAAGVSYTTGYSSYLINAGELTNRGLETALHITPIKTRDWRLTVGGNYTFNENKLVSITSDLNRIAISGSSYVYGVSGYSFPVIIGTDYKRDSEGRVIVDKNTGYPSVASESKILGNTQPKHRLGVDMTVSWKSFTLSNLFEYRGGYIIFDSGAGTYDFSGSSARSAYYNRERFVFPNSSYLDATTGKYVANTNITVSDGGSGYWTSTSFNTNINSNYIYSGNYWKWREVSLAYKLPASVLKKVRFIKAATISVQGRNLLLFTPKSNEYTDPDYSANGSTSNAIGVTNLSQTPPTRYYGGTLSVTF